MNDLDYVRELLDPTATVAECERLSGKGEKRGKEHALRRDDDGRSRSKEDHFGSKLGLMRLVH